MHQTAISPAGASQTVVAIYLDYAETAAQFEEPNAEAVADFLGAEGLVV